MALSTRTDVQTIDPSEVASLVSVVSLSFYFQIATVTVLVYDTSMLSTTIASHQMLTCIIVITSEREARYFWKIPKKTVNFVYFVASNRLVGNICC
ncbi:hypothetical protein ACEPAH_9292 [Sanghuangporus vaninii]